MLQFAIENPIFFVEVLVNGLLSGVMYALVAIGFVLIYKASGVFNFAQGSMLFFASLTFVGLTAPIPVLGLFNVELGFWAAVVVTLAVMVGLALAIERLMLRPLVNQPLITLFMATLGLFYLVEGLATLVWDTQPHELKLGISAAPLKWAQDNLNLALSAFDVTAALIAGVLVAGFGFFFSKTRTGRALRAVADDHQAAMSVGIPLQQIWAVTWAAAGLVALVAGMMWGAQSAGVQQGLALVALKALPVLIIGGFDSIAGAIIGGLLIGAAEKLFETFVGSEFGGATENWFPYVFAMLFLIFRPHGLFGREIIGRV